MLTSPAIKAVVILSVFVAIASHDASAQRIRGRVVDAATGDPIPAALLTALDSARNVKLRRLTTTGGAFDVELAAGTKKVTVEFVGYRPGELSLTTDPVQTFTIGLQPMPMTLSGVVAEAENRCGKSEDPNIVTAWYAARAALGSSRVGSDRSFRTREFQRTLNAKLGTEGTDSMSFRISKGTDAYEAASAESLAEFGYIRTEKGRVSFYGPDAELLLSDEFVNSHCFGITRQSASKGLVGLRFWPTAEGPKADIKGVMWLNERTNNLEFVEFTFTDPKPVRTNLGRVEKTNEALKQGRVNFRRLADGSWIIADWYIRVPRQAAFPFGNTGRARILEIGAIEGGGEFLGLHSESAAPDDVGRITGVVYDSTAGRPLANATVYLAGMKHRTTTDSAGAFRFDDVTSGIHYVVLDHALLATRPMAEKSTRVNVQRGQLVAATLATPRAETILRTLCPSARMKEVAKQLGWKGDLGVATGRVTSKGRRTAGATVEAEWDLGTPGRSEINLDFKALTDETNQTGAFVICGVPVGMNTTLRARLEGTAGVSEYIRNIPRVLGRDLDIPN